MLVIKCLLKQFKRTKLKKCVLTAFLTERVWDQNTTPERMHLIGYVLIMTYRIFKRIFQPLLCWYASSENRSYTEIMMDGIIRCYMLLIETDYGLEIYRQSLFKWEWGSHRWRESHPKYVCSFLMHCNLIKRLCEGYSNWKLNFLIWFNGIWFHRISLW